MSAGCSSVSFIGGHAVYLSCRHVSWQCRTSILARRSAAYQAHLRSLMQLLRRYYGEAAAQFSLTPCLLTQNRTVCHCRTSTLARRSAAYQARLRSLVQLLHRYYGEAAASFSRHSWPLTQNTTSLTVMQACELSLRTSILARRSAAYQAHLPSLVQLLHRYYGESAAPFS